jgi:hypothetical protein
MRSLLCAILFGANAFAGCYEFSGRILESASGSVSLIIDNGSKIKLEFDEADYNPHLPRGVHLEGNAIGIDGRFVSNKYSIDVPSRTLASLPSKYYLRELSNKDKNQCLKNSLE